MSTPIAELGSLIPSVEETDALLRELQYRRFQRGIVVDEWGYPRVNPDGTYMMDDQSEGPPSESGSEGQETAESSDLDVDDPVVANRASPIDNLVPSLGFVAGASPIDNLVPSLGFVAGSVEAQSEAQQDVPPVDYGELIAWMEVAGIH